MWEIFKRKRDREYYGPTLLELGHIAFAAVLALCGFFLIFRSLFGTPLGPAVLHDLSKNHKPAIEHTAPEAQESPQTQGTPGEVTVGIAPKN